MRPVRGCSVRAELARGRSTCVAVTGHRASSRAATSYFCREEELQRAVLCCHSTPISIPDLCTRLACHSGTIQLISPPLPQRISKPQILRRTRKPTRHPPHEYLENCVGFARDYAEWPHPSTWAVVRHESPTLGVDEARWPQHTVNSQVRIL